MLNRRKEKLLSSFWLPCFYQCFFSLMSDSCRYLKQALVQLGKCCLVLLQIGRNIETLSIFYQHLFKKKTKPSVSAVQIFLYLTVFFTSFLSVSSPLRKQGWCRRGFASLRRNRLRSALHLLPVARAGLPCSEGSALECRHGRRKTHTLTTLWIKTQNCTSLGSCHCKDSHTTL